MSRGRWKWRAGLTALLTVIVVGTNGSAAPNAEKIYRKVLPSVVTLTVETDSGERFVGSGVVALRDDLLVTAWHVVWDARAVWATFYDGQRVKVTGYVGCAAERDLALLKLERAFSGRQAQLARTKPPVASRAYVVGAPKGFGFSISDGLISQIRQVDGFSQFQVSCPISPGNSGGPVLNERGEVFAIASWTKSDAQNVSFAVPIQEISRLDAARRPVGWSELSNTNRPAPLRLDQEPSGLPAAADSGKKAGTLEEFHKHWEEAAGRTVTIIVEEGVQRNEYQFVVPQRPLKARGGGNF